MFKHIASLSLGRPLPPPRAEHDAATPAPPDRPSRRSSALHALGYACALGFFAPPPELYVERQKREVR
jgi:hypothetical protein